MKAQKLLFLLILSGMMSFIVFRYFNFQGCRAKSSLCFIMVIGLDHCMDISFPKCIDLCSYSPEISRHHI